MIEPQKFACGADVFVSAEGPIPDINGLMFGVPGSKSENIVTWIVKEPGILHLVFVVAPECFARG